jgi:N-acetylglucosaminyldiphosphoundecaprenol N-acetyl-beta-D-mannosaminyltransferase
MSLIGPRPEFLELAATFDDDFVKERLAVRPGISGFWQISDASTGLIGEAPEFDRLYLAKASIRVDAWVLRRTLGGLFGGRTLSIDQFPQWITGLPMTSVSPEGDGDSLTSLLSYVDVGDSVDAQENPSLPNDTVGQVSSFTCCSVRIDAHTLDSAVDVLLTRPSQQVGRSVHLCNAYTMSLARRDFEMANQLNEADVNLPDGMPLIWIGRWLGFKHLVGRVYGPDLMLATMDRGRAKGVSHFLYGSTNEVLETLEIELRRRFPGLRIVGRESPPFCDLTGEEEVALLQSLSELKPDIVWVALGTPKQDAFVYEFSLRSSAAFVAVGAAFDFISGEKSQAPVWMRERGLEWIFRLAHEPRRLASRYLVHNFRFVAAVIRDRPSVNVS